MNDPRLLRGMHPSLGQLSGPIFQKTCPSVSIERRAPPVPRYERANTLRPSKNSHLIASALAERAVQAGRLAPAFRLRDDVGAPIAMPTCVQSSSRPTIFAP